MRRTRASLEKRGKRSRNLRSATRASGEMDADQLADTTMDPRHRTLRKVTLREPEQAERVFDLLMGNDVAPAQGLHHRLGGGPRPGRASTPEPLPSAYA